MRTAGARRGCSLAELDPTEFGDLKALRAAFEINGDGQLTAADQGSASFEVMVPNTDGSTGAVADTSLVSEANGSRVTQTASMDGSGDRLVEGKCYDSSNNLLYVITTSVERMVVRNNDGLMGKNFGFAKIAMGQLLTLAV